MNADDGGRGVAKAAKAMARGSTYIFMGAICTSDIGNLTLMLGRIKIARLLNVLSPMYGREGISLESKLLEYARFPRPRRSDDLLLRHAGGALPELPADGPSELRG